MGAIPKICARNQRFRQAMGKQTKHEGESGREDLNLRPLRPERSALAKLSYSPVVETRSIARVAKDCKL